MPWDYQFNYVTYASRLLRSISICDVYLRNHDHASLSTLG